MLWTHIPNWHQVNHLTTYVWTAISTSTAPTRFIMNQPKTPFLILSSKPGWLMGKLSFHPMISGFKFRCNLQNMSMKMQRSFVVRLCHLRGKRNCKFNGYTLIQICFIMSLKRIFLGMFLQIYFLKWSKRMWKESLVRSWPIIFLLRKGLKDVHQRLL